jgi:DNA mismatch endonuclease (patch repair protein)
MTDMFTPQERSRIMSRIRSRGNAATELRFIEILKMHKITGWRRSAKLPGQPDFVFRTARVVVFIDGDFWHGNPKGFRLPRSNLDYWTKKILSNRRRDRRVNRQLRSQGWKILRFWQSALKNENAVASRLWRVLRTSDLLDQKAV